MILLLMVAGYLFGALAALLFARGWVGRWLTAAGAIIGGACAVTLAAAEVFGFDIGSFQIIVVLAKRPWWLQGGVIQDPAQPLSAVFLAVVGMVAIPAALYSIGYTRAWEGRRSLRMPGAMLNLFLLSMSLVPLAENIF